MPYAWRSTTFLAGMVTGSVGLPEGAPYCQVSARAYALQRAIPSARGRVTPRSSSPLHGKLRILNRIAITSPCRVPLSPRLTLSRLTSLRKPWVFGVNFSIFIVVTYAYIFLSSRSRISHDTPSRLTGMLPYRCIQHTSHSFGAGFDARSSSTHHRSTSELLRTL